MILAPFVFASLLFSKISIAHAAISNPNVSPENLPDQSCKVRYPKTDGGGAILCSGTLISKNLILTAIHCEQIAEDAAGIDTKEKADINTEVTCGRIPESRKVVDRIWNPNFDTKGTYYGTYDVAVLKVAQEFDFDPVELPSSEDEIIELLHDGYCGEFGYGFNIYHKDLGISQGGIGPDTTYIEYNKNRAFGKVPLPETRIDFHSFNSMPGDSGGGVLCKRVERKRRDWSRRKPRGNWIIVGIAAHDGHANSLAPSLDWISGKFQIQ